MHERGHDPEAVAHHLNRVVFCLFAEDARLLPPRILTGMIESRRSDPEEFDRGLSALFRIMSDREAGRFFGNDRVEWFNGGLFDGAEVIPCTADELRAMHDAALLDWSRVEPAILGTLFERGLDPDKRGQLGAHYTDHAKIMMVVEPVVLDPLRREFAAMRERVEELTAGREPTPLTLDGRRRERLPAWERNAEAAWRAFLERLRSVHVLDPACGSGNFLYVTLRLLKDLEDEAIKWGAQRLRITREFPQVDPHNVLGIEINPYAKELAGVSIWIGHIQWMLDHGSGFARDPVLHPLDNIELRDAILAYDAEGAPVPATWPQAEFVVGNPPFLGTKLMRLSLGDGYVDDLFEAWREAVARESDLACYWHELARREIAEGATRRAGLLATNSIRGGANRKTLDRVKDSGDIFMAWSDEPWVVEGAAVRVSIVGQDDGSETECSLDGEPVGTINGDLTSGVDLTQARVLAENKASSFMGDTKGGAFDIPGEVAREMLTQPTNVNGRPNADVVVPWVNGMDITRRSRGMFIVDFGTDASGSEAAAYEAPFEYVLEHVQSARGGEPDDPGALVVARTATVGNANCSDPALPIHRDPEGGEAPALCLVLGPHLARQRHYRDCAGRRLCVRRAALAGARTVVAAHGDEPRGPSALHAHLDVRDVPLPVAPRYAGRGADRRAARAPRRHRRGGAGARRGASALAQPARTRPRGARRRFPRCPRACSPSTRTQSASCASARSRISTMPAPRGSRTSTKRSTPPCSRHTGGRRPGHRASLGEEYLLRRLLALNLARGGS